MLMMKMRWEMLEVMWRVLTRVHARRRGQVVERRGAVEGGESRGRGHSGRKSHGSQGRCGSHLRTATPEQIRDWNMNTICI